MPEMKSLPLTLNESQTLAVQALDPHDLVIAGAGSGKTRVLVAHALHLLEEGVHPNYLFLLTFTNAAALEMRQRLEEHLPNSNLPFVGTFHSLCASTLRSWGTKTGLGADYTIYDAVDQEDVLKTIIDDFNLKKVKMKDALKCVSNSMTPNSPDLELLIAKYHARLLEYKGVDYEGLMSGMIKLMQHSECGNAVVADMKYILVDEYQDTNPRQETILQLMKPEHLYVVGDPGQAIYAFRGADRNHILSFPARYPDCGEFTLPENYRSAKPIVDIANIIAGKFRDNKLILKSMQDTVGQVSCRWFADPDEEARYIATDVSELVNNGYEPDDIAILSRTNSRLEPIAHRLQVPYAIVSGDDPLDSPAFRLFTDAMTLTLNPFDELRAIKLLRFFGVPNIEIKRMRLNAGRAKMPLSTWAAQHEHAAFNAMVFIENMREMIQDTGYTMTGREFATVFIASCHPEEIYLKQGKVTKAREVTDAVERIKQWQSNYGDLDYSEFLRWYRLRDIQDLENAGKVTLTSIHGAKGLEFKAVFIIGMVDGHLPHMKCSTQEEHDEELRMFYVAVTRAKERLYITGYHGNYYRESYRERRPSPFLEDLGFENELGYRE